MSDKTKELKRRLNRALKKREPWEAGYQDCYDYALPGRTSFFERSKGQDAPEIFDETAVVAVPEFASRMQAGLTPNYGQYIKLEAGMAVPEDQREEVNTALEKATNYVQSVIDNSNFAQEANECYIDVALGTACMDIFEGDAVDPIVCAAVPLPELAIDTGPRDEIDTYFRTRKMRVSHIEEAYPGSRVPPELHKKLESAKEEEKDPYVKVAIASYRKRNTPNEEINLFCIFLPEHEDIPPLYEQEVKGAGSQRFIGFRWSKATGEAWGRGPLFNVMPAVRTTNLVMQMILENAEMAIAGIYTVEDDGVLSTDNVRLLPGTIMPIAPGSRGLQQIANSGNFDVAQLVLSDMRANIKRGLYNEMLGDPNRTPMSATEVAQRMADLARQIGSAFGRLQVEFVNRVVQRVIYILRKKGLLELPNVNGREIILKSTSPLSQAQAVEDINAVNNMLTMFNQQFGPQLAQLMMDQEAAALYLQDRFGVPANLIRDKAERTQIMQALQQAQAQQQQMPQMAGEENGGEAPPP